MRSLVFLLGTILVSQASADVVGQWQGIAALGPSNVAQGMDGDQLIKLQISKAFLKTLDYQFNFKADKSFTSAVHGADMKPRTGKGTYSVTGNILTITFTEENHTKRNKSLKGTLTPDGKKFVISIDSKPGLPPTKLVFARKGATNPQAPAKSKSGQNTRH